MPFKVKKEELFTIPNILCYVRFLLIPVFAFVYLKAESPKDFYIAGAILIVAALTDGIDGFMARQFNMCTEWGKMIDPIIDKLLQVVVALCLCKKHPLMWAVVALLVIKEGYMGYKGWRNLKAGGSVKGALWFGKVCTAVLFVSFVAIVMFGSMPTWANQGIIILDIIVMLIVLWLYVVAFRRVEIDARIKARKAAREEADKGAINDGKTEDKVADKISKMEDKVVDDIDEVEEKVVVVEDKVAKVIDKDEHKVANDAKDATVGVAGISEDLAKSIAKFNMNVIGKTAELNIKAVAEVDKVKDIKAKVDKEEQNIQ